jgi:hypothetical protein
MQVRGLSQMEANYVVGSCLSLADMRFEIDKLIESIKSKEWRVH